MPDAAASFHRHASLLRAGGTNRLQRTLPGMEAGYIQCDERGLSDLLAYAAAAAEQLRFHSVSGHAVGDWGALFDDLRDGGTGAILDDAGLARLMASENAMAPQLALLLGFFEAFGHLQQDFNRLPARHLAHYFGNVLGLGRRAAAPDRAHVIFTPASTTSTPRLIPLIIRLRRGKLGASGWVPIKYSDKTAPCCWIRRYSSRFSRG